MRKDTAIALALGSVLGCGSGGGSSDIPEPDAGEERMAPDGEPLPAVGACSVERAGVSTSVVFHDAEGLPLATVETDDDGVARHDACVSGGMVTVVIPLLAGGGGGTYSRLMTVQGVQPGDHVLLDPPLLPEPSTAPLTITVENDDDEVTGGADSYVARLGDCGPFEMPLDDENGGELEMEELDRSCLGYDPDDFSVVSVAKDAEGQVHALARVDSSDLEDPVTASGGTWVAHDGTTSVSLSGWPQGPAGAFLVVSPLIDGAFYSRDSHSIDSGEASIEVDYWPASIADEHRLALAVSYGTGITSLLRMRTSEQPPTSIDLSEELFAPPSQLVLQVADKTRPVYMWQGGDDRAVLTRSEITWTAEDHSGVWIVVAPDNPGSTTVPVMPEKLASLGPGPQATIHSGRLLLVDKGIDYSEWLAAGLSSSSSEEDLTPEELTEHEGVTLRHAGYSPES